VVAREQVEAQALAEQPWRGRRRKAEASGGRGKRYRGGCRAGPDWQRLKAEGGRRVACGVWLGRTGLEAWANRACGSGRVGQRVRKGWLGRRFSRPRQLCGLGQAGVG